MHPQVRKLKIPENKIYKMSAKISSQLPYSVFLTESVNSPSRLPMAVYSREYNKDEGLGNGRLKEIRLEGDFDKFMENVEILESWITPEFERIAESQNFDF